MKISFTTMATPELDIPSQFKTARAYGFDGVDLRVIQRGNGEISRDITQAEAERIVAQQNGVEVPTLLCYNERIETGRDSMIASVLEHMQFAAKLGIPTIRVFTGVLKTPEAVKMLVDVLKTVFEQDTTGTKIGMQNHLNCGITARQGIEVCKQVNDPRLSVILSPDHCVLINEDLEPMLPELAKYTSQLYVADVNEENKSVFPGQGKIPYRKILSTLQENDFDGYVTFKWERCWHPELPHYDEAFRAFRSWIDKTGILL